MTRKIRTTNAKVRSVAKPYEPTPGERLLMESHFARQAQTPAAPRLKVSDDSSGATQIAPDHPDPRMALALLIARGRFEPQRLFRALSKSLM